VKTKKEQFLDKKLSQIGFTKGQSFKALLWVGSQALQNEIQTAEEERKKKINADIPNSIPTSDHLQYKRLRFKAANSDYEKEEKNIYRKYASIVTVQNIVDNLNKVDNLFVRVHSKKRGPLVGTTKRVFFNKLMKAGLTLLDCWLLPRETVTPGVEGKITKKEWLSKHVYVLGTISPDIIYNLAKALRIDENDLTIGKLLELVHVIDVGTGRYCEVHGPINTEVFNGLSVRRLYNTWKKLAEIGLSGSSPLLHGLKPKQRLQALARKISKKYSLDSEDAALVATIAQKEGWVKFYY
jgi:hypothetical protein